MEIATPERKFILVKNGNETVLPDPNPQFTPEQVRKHYSTQYPELVTCTAERPRYEGDKVVYRFKPGVGIKG